jgi:hypothetical protein
LENCLENSTDVGFTTAAKQRPTWLELLKLLQTAVSYKKVNYPRKSPIELLHMSIAEYNKMAEKKAKLTGEPRKVIENLWLQQPEALWGGLVFQC